MLHISYIIKNSSIISIMIICFCCLLLGTLNVLTAIFYNHQLDVAVGLVGHAGNGFFKLATAAGHGAHEHAHQWQCVVLLGLNEGGLRSVGVLVEGAFARHGVVPHAKRKLLLALSAAG